MRDAGGEALATRIDIEMVWTCDFLWSKRADFRVVVRKIKYAVARLGEGLTHTREVRSTSKGSTTEKDVVEHIEIGAEPM